MASRGMTQLKVGLRVRDVEASCELYLKLGFKQIPERMSHAQRKDAAMSGPLGSGFVLAIPAHVRATSRDQGADLAPLE